MNIFNNIRPKANIDVLSPSPFSPAWDHLSHSFILATFFTHFSCDPASNSYMKTKQKYFATFPVSTDSPAHEVELPVFWAQFKEQRPQTSSLRFDTVHFSNVV